MPLVPAGDDVHANSGYIDVNTEIGPPHGRQAGADPEDLARERRSHGVRFAMVRHRNALWGMAGGMGPTLPGNRLAMEATDRDPGLLPIAALAPERPARSAEEDAIHARAAGFWLEGRAAPTGRSVSTDPLIRWAARMGKPLFVPIAAWGDATAIGAATAGLGVPVILVGAHYTNSIDDLAAAERWEHLYLETSRMAHFRAIETAVGALGPERVLFGTGAPVRAIQSSLNAISQARISDDAKRAILGGNATRLFGLAPRPVVLPTVALPARAIDVHAHTGPMLWDGPDLPDDQLLPELARQNGTRMTVSSSVLAIVADTEAGNLSTVESCRSIPNRFGYLVGDPNDLDATRAQIARWGESPGIVGIKVHSQWSGQPTASPAMWELFNVLADYGRPVKIHNDGDGWDQALKRIAAAHPRLPIIVAHAGPGIPSLEGAALTATTDNIYLEMSSTYANIGIVRKMVGIVPRHKFLFGTDVPLIDPAFVLGTYQDAGFPADQEPAVYYDNAARLFGLD